MSFRSTISNYQRDHEAIPKEYTNPRSPGVSTEEIVRIEVIPAAGKEASYMAKRRAKIYVSTPLGSSFHLFSHNSNYLSGSLRDPSEWETQK
ncbi:hypothetical protein OUZ56_023782 [Daphnia magna]|uniref:Uncharacterized protein n=1 Tax=Daphnia magna TaxID=35525 RepID=A0ABR0AZV0_9CRUS|nr:hypothetical protein OUZ56_023782 [Daphnia magna]